MTLTALRLREKRIEEIRPACLLWHGIKAILSSFATDEIYCNGFRLEQIQSFLSLAFCLKLPPITSQTEAS